ncbi:MAG TPA: 2-oxoacid:acceptor oxidoreductase family protein [Actinospica sp.]|nr:2-oxoacid:acceptor oxidoreductase family protein [Actinospica sp.]
MYQIRLHGRGGQGVVTAAELIAAAAIHDGRYALAFPSFGSERTGAPVEAYCRIDDAPIRGREPVDAPDAVLVLDATLLARPGIFRGLRPHGLALVNSAKDLDIAEVPQLRTVPATRIALARTGRALPNVPMLGAFAAASGTISREAMHTAIELRFPGALARANRDGADEAYVRMTAAENEDEAVEFDVPAALAAEREAHHVVG